MITGLSWSAIDNEPMGLHGTLKLKISQIRDNQNFSVYTTNSSKMNKRHYLVVIDG